MTFSFDIVIVGAGLAGLGAAIALSKKGHHVTVLEATAQLQAIGGLISFGPNTHRVLEKYGVYDKFIETCALPPKASSIRRYNNDAEVLAFRAAEDMETRYGFPWLIVHRADFQSILHQAVRRQGVEIRLGSPVAKVDPSSPAVILEDGTRIEADLIVASDGIRSAIRKELVGNDFEFEKGIDVCRLLLSEKSMRSDPEIMHLLERHDLWYGPGRIVVGASARRGNSLVYSMELAYPGDVSTSGASKKRVDMQKLREDFVDFDPVIQKVLTHVDEGWLWRLASVPDFIPWINEEENIVLVGDSAHAMLPHASHGGAMCIEDGACLAECLDRATMKEDLGKCINAYETIRKPRTALLSRFADQRSISGALSEVGAIQERDAKLQSSHLWVGLVWNGKHVDENPESPEDPLWGPWLLGHDAVAYSNRKLDQIFA